ncbi:hypothetical protein CCP4SC76_6040004 [Gammaproteobacteria bacterium]
MNQNAFNGNGKAPKGSLPKLPICLQSKRLNSGGKKLNGFWHCKFISVYLIHKYDLFVTILKNKVELDAMVTEKL